MNRNTEALRIITAVKPREIRQFIDLPRTIYSDDSNWVPSIRLFDVLDYRFKQNDLFRRSDYTLLLAQRDGVAVGRMVIYIDPHADRYNGRRIAYFGAFECIDDQEAVDELFAHARAWAGEHGADLLRGPMDPDSQSWGVVTEGFSCPPVFMSPHSRPYYDARIRAAGLGPAKELLAFEADAKKGYEIPERFEIFADRLLERHPELTVRRLEPARLKDDAREILEVLNEGVAGNWGFVPVSEDEMREIVTKLKLIYDPDAIWFVCDKGRPVACALGFPDANRLIKAIDGKLLPFGLLRFLKGRSSLTDYRLWGLAIRPEYQGRGLDVLLYINLCRALKPKGVRLEASYVLADNYRMRNALEKLGMEIIKRYMVYEMPLEAAVTS